MEIYTAAARYNLYRAAGHRIPEHSLAELIRLFTGYHEVISDQHWSMCQHYQPHYPPWHHQTHHVAQYLSTYHGGFNLNPVTHNCWALSDLFLGIDGRRMFVQGVRYVITLSCCYNGKSDQLDNLQCTDLAICHYHKITVSLSYFSPNNLWAAFLEIFVKANIFALNKEMVIARVTMFAPSCQLGL